MQRYYRKWMLAQVAADFLLINVAFVLAYYVRYDLHFPMTVAEANYVHYAAYIPISLMVSLGLIAIYRFEGLYAFVRSRSWLEEFYGLLSGTFTGMVFTIAIFFIYRADYFSRLIYLYVGIFTVLLLLLARLVKRQIWSELRKHGIGVDRVVIVGAGEVGLAVLRNIIAQPELGYRVVGFLDDDPTRSKVEIGPFCGLGTTFDIGKVICDCNVDEAIVTLPWSERDKITRVVQACEEAGIRLKIVPDLFQLSLSRVSVDTVGSIPLLGVKEPTMSAGGLAVKRAIDVVLTILILILDLPLMLIIAACIKLDSPGPAIFRQKRVGRGGQIFTAYKFRTMHVGAEQEIAELKHLNQANGALFKIRNDPRTTRVGRYLRRLSLDELPQTFNVLRGEMSLVGPRPALVDEAARYEDWHKRRLEVSPGITGLWQVSGRSDLTFEEMVLLDTYYIENWSPWLDFQIILRTIPSVLLARGAY